MKQTITLLACAAVVLLTGCAGLTKGIETARTTVLGTIDTVRATVNSGFDVASKGAGAAEKIAGAATEGAKDTVQPVVNDPATP